MVVAQEVAPAGISMRPVLVVIQTLFLRSTAIFPKEVGEPETAGGVKVVEGGGLPPVIPPPPPQAESDRKKVARRTIRDPGPTSRLTRVPPDSGQLRAHEPPEPAIAHFGREKSGMIFIRLMDHTASLSPSRLSADASLFLHGLYSSGKSPDFLIPYAFDPTTLEAVAQSLNYEKNKSY